MPSQNKMLGLQSPKCGEMSRICHGVRSLIAQLAVRRGYRAFLGLGRRFGLGGDLAVLRRGYRASRCNPFLGFGHEKASFLIVFSGWMVILRFVGVIALSGLQPPPWPQPASGLSRFALQPIPWIC